VPEPPTARIRDTVPLSTQRDLPVTAIPYDSGYDYPVPEPFRQPRRRSRIGKFFTIFAALSILLCGACGIGGFLVANHFTTKSNTAASPTPHKVSPSPTDEASPGTHTVVYEVTGDGPAIIAYSTGQGRPGNDQTTLPWHKELTLDKPWTLNIFAIQPLGGKIACRILLDGQQVATDDRNNSTVTCNHVMIP
jgi:hypothetical protein